MRTAEDDAHADGRFRVDDPEHWRQRARQALALAEQMHDTEAKAIMVDVAAGYERLARRAASRLLR